MPVTALRAAQMELEPRGIAVTTHVSQGLGHGVDDIGLRMGAEFVASAFGL